MPQDLGDRVILENRDFETHPIHITMIPLSRRLRCVVRIGAEKERFTYLLELLPQLDLYLLLRVEASPSSLRVRSGFMTFSCSLISLLSFVITRSDTDSHVGQ